MPVRHARHLDALQQWPRRRCRFRCLAVHYREAGPGGVSIGILPSRRRQVRHEVFRYARARAPAQSPKPAESSWTGRAAEGARSVRQTMRPPGSSRPTQSIWAHRSEGRLALKRRASTWAPSEPDESNVLLPRLQGTAALQVSDGY